jgi:hypothetical protein
MEEPDLHFREWMKPYLPSEAKYRDIMLMVLGILIVTVLSIAIMQFNEAIGVGLGVVGTGHFGAHYVLRAIARYHSRRGK